MKIINDLFSVEFIHQYDFENRNEGIEGNEDIVVNYNGSRYSATVFTISNIIELMDNYRSTGECKGGLYFYCQDMLIVKNLKRKTIIDTISHLIEVGEFEIVMKKLKEF
jgi:hypothetical protein